MRRMIRMLLLLVLLLPGCCGVSREEFDAAVAERDALRTELQELRENPGMVEVKVKGNFTATVRGLLPDYVSDDKTPCIALVTLFQSTPFPLMGIDASELETGKTYVFEVEMDRYVGITEEEYESGSHLEPQILFPLYHPHIGISGVRPAEKSECGLDSVRLEYEVRET